MKKTVFLQFIVFLTLLTTLAFGQSELARDEEFLIRGLLRDGLYEVAAERLQLFIIQYPDYPKNLRLIEEISRYCYQEGYFSLLRSLSSSYFELQEKEIPRKGEMSFFYAISKAKTEDIKPIQEFVVDLMGASSIPQGRKLLLARLLFKSFTSELDYITAVNLRNTYRYCRNDEEINLQFAELEYQFGEVEAALDLLQNLLSARNRNVAVSAAVSIAEKEFLQADFQVILDSLESVEVQEVREAGLSQQYKFYKFFALVNLARFEEAFAIYSDQLELPSQDETLIATFKALDDFNGLTRYTENLYLIAEGEEKKRLSEKLIFYYEKSGNFQSLRSHLQSLLENSSGSERANILLKLADLSLSPQDKIEYLKGALQSERRDERKIEVVEKLADLFVQTNQNDELLLLFVNNEDLPLKRNERNCYSLLLATLLGNRQQFARSQEIYAELVANPMNPDEIRLQALEHYISSQFATGELQPILDILHRLESDRLLLQLDSNSLKKLFRAGLSANELVIVEVCAELLLIRGELSSQEKLKWASLYSNPLLPKKQALLKSIISGDDRKAAIVAARSLADIYIQHNEHEHLNVLIQELRSGEKTREIKAISYLLEAKQALALEDMVSFRALLADLSDFDPESEYRNEILEHYRALAEQRGNYSFLLNNELSFASVEPTVVYKFAKSLNRAQRLYHFGDYQAVLDIYSEYPWKQKLTVEHKFMYAHTLYLTKNLQEAGNFMEQLGEEKLYPQWLSIRTRVLADAAHSRSQWQQALDLYETIYDREQTYEVDDSPLLKMAESAEATGDWQLASKYFKDYVNSYKQILGAPVLERISRSFENHSDYKNAIEIIAYLQKREKNVQQSSEYAFRVAELREKSAGAIAGAEALLAVAYDYVDNDEIASRARLQAAEKYLKLNERQLAIRQFRIVAERYPTLENGRQAAARLVQLAGIEQTIEEEILQ
jgi:hypothetical protein